MGNHIIWKRPQLDEGQSEYELIEIWRAASSGGSFSLISTVDITDLDYYDIDGQTTDYYKIRYKDTDATKYSAYSTEIAATGTQTVYCGTREVMDVIQQNTTTLPDNLSWDAVLAACQDASAEVDGITKTVHGRTASFSLLFDSNTLSLGRYIELPYRNLTALTSVELQYSNGTWTTLTSGISGDYETDLTKGRVYLHWKLGMTPYSGFQDIRVIGTYGVSTVSASVRTLTKLLAAQKVLVGLTGGSWNGVQSYSQGKVSYNFGNKAANLQAAVGALDRLLLDTANRLGLSAVSTAVRVH